MTRRALRSSSNRTAYPTACGKIDEVDRLGVQHAVAIGEVMHLGGCVGLDEPVELCPPAGGGGDTETGCSGSAYCGVLPELHKHPLLICGRGSWGAASGGGSSPPLRPQPANPVPAATAHEHGEQHRGCGAVQVTVRVSGR